MADVFVSYARGDQPLAEAIGGDQLASTHTGIAGVERENDKAQTCKETNAHAGDLTDKLFTSLLAPVLTR
jgi:hypothetical protein